VTFFLLVLFLAGGGICLKRVVPAVPTPLLVVAGASLLGLYLFGLSQFLLLVFFLAVLALLCVGAGWLQGEDRERQPAAVQRRARDDVADLNTLSGFTRTLTALQTRWALSAHRHGHGMAEELEAALGKLAGSGALTPEVRSELINLTQSHLARVHALTEEGQAVLVELAGRYDPRAAPQLWLRLLKERWQRRLSG
jgi:hypothetical protein